MSKRTEARAYAVHYFEMLFQAAGLTWRADNVVEVENMIDATIDAAKEELAEGGYGKGGFRETSKATTTDDVPQPPLGANANAPDCPYCKQKAEIVRSTYLYGPDHDYGWIWLCEDCDAYVGCHKGTTIPYGTPANPEARAARKKAHAAFDPIWRDGGISRTEAYAWLCEELELHEDECHIARFDVELCERTVELCEGKLEDMK